MSKSRIRAIFKTARKVITKHGPEIAIGFGVAGMITTTVLVVPATSKAIKLKEKAEKEKGSKLTVKETVKACWKPYLPAAVTGVASVGCIIGGSATNVRRNAALVSAYKLSENALTEYRDKVTEVVGEAKEKVIHEAAVREAVKPNMPNDYEITRTGTGDVLFYDELCGRFFTSDSNYIDKVVNLLNRRMRYEMYISLNDFYSEFPNLEPNDIGNYIGWNIDRGYIDVEYSSDLSDDTVPYVVLRHKQRPDYKFDYS